MLKVGGGLKRKRFSDLLRQPSQGYKMSALEMFKVMYFRLMAAIFDLRHTSILSSQNKFTTHQLANMAAQNRKL